MKRKITVDDALRMVRKTGGTSETSIASKTNLGCVIIGDGINVRSDGTIWTEHNVYEAMTNTEIDNICK